MRSAVALSGMGWIYGGLVALGLGSLALIAKFNSGTEQQKPVRPGPGWYVLLYEDDYLKEYRGPSATKAQADQLAKEARAQGWRTDANARAVVEHRSRAPF